MVGEMGVSGWEAPTSLRGVFTLENLPLNGEAWLGISRFSFQFGF
jgi:hypothetical protein